MPRNVAWSKADDDKGRKMYADGVPIEEIGRSLSIPRTPGAVRGHAYRYGWERVIRKKHNHKNAWTEDEDFLLMRAAANDEHFSTVDLPGRTRKAIQSRAYKIGAVAGHNNTRPWTVKEDRIAKTMWFNGKKPREIADELNRSYNAIKSRACAQRWKRAENIF